MRCVTVTLLDGTTWMVSDELLRGRSSGQLWEWMRRVSRAVGVAGALRHDTPSNEVRPTLPEPAREPGVTNPSNSSAT